MGGALGTMGGGGGWSMGRRRLLGDLIGTRDRGRPRPPDLRGHERYGELPERPYEDIGPRNPLPGWPGDNPIADGQGGMGPRQLINYRGLPGFKSFQDSFPPGPIPWRRRIDMDPGQYGQGLQYRDPAMLQQLSDATMGYRNRGTGPQRQFSGQGFGLSDPSDALRRLLMARIGGGF